MPQNTVARPVRAYAFLVAAAVLSGAAGTPSRHDRVVAGRVTHLPLPRFASLRSDDVNLRVGPGRRYPIAWVLHRRFLPVEIKREFKEWRQVRIPDGTEGWVHSSIIVARRSFYVKTGPMRTVHAAATKHSSPVARLQAHVVGRIVSCAAQVAWCRVEVGSVEGYLERDAFWGTFAAEAVPG